MCWLPACSLGQPRPAAAQPAAVACTESALLAAIGQANANGGGTITFTCRNTTIPILAGLGTIADHVVIDGEDRNITLEYTGNFAGCDVGDNGASGPAIGHMRGRRSIVRRLTFRNFLESLQIIGPENTVEKNVFLAHPCSDDGLSTTTMQAVNTRIRNNRFQGYRDKAYQMSYGSGTIEGNTFIDSAQPIRGPYDNTLANDVRDSLERHEDHQQPRSLHGRHHRRHVSPRLRAQHDRVLSRRAPERRHAGDPPGQRHRRQPAAGGADRRQRHRLAVNQHHHQQRPHAGHRAGGRRGGLGKRSGRSRRRHAHARRTAGRQSWPEPAPGQRRRPTCATCGAATRSRPKPIAGITRRSSSSSINDRIGLVDVDPLGSVCGPIDGQPPAAPTGLRIIAPP